jgi:thiol-disulfide isomerase/thioredoxin
MAAASAADPTTAAKETSDATVVDEADVTSEAPELATQRAALPGARAPGGAASAAFAEEGPDGLGILALIVFVVLAGVLIFAFSGSLASAIAQQEESPCRALEPTQRPGEIIPLTAKDMDGNEVTLSQLAGKFVVLNFWATWCEPCTREWPELDKLARRLEDRDDVVIVAVSLDQDPGLIRPYLARMGLSDTPVVVWSDVSADGNRGFGGEKLPDTYFIDEAGRYVMAFINVRRWGMPAGARCVESRVGLR